MNRTLVTIFLFLACETSADTLLVTNKRDASLAFVSLQDMKVVAKVTTGEEPHEVAVSGDGKIAVVSNYGTYEAPGTSLSVVDVRSRRIMRRVDLPGLARPHGIQSAGSRFYMTTEGSLAVARYDALTQQVDWVAGTGQAVTHMLVVTPNERRIYTANIGSHTVSVLDLTTPRDVAVKQIPVTRNPEGMDLSPDGSALWVAGVARRNEVAQISVIDTKTNTVARTLPINTKLANRLKFTPDGTRVVVSDPGTNQLFILDAATGETVNTIATAAGPSGLLMTPDGMRLFVACANAGKVQVIETRTWSIVGEVATGNEPDGMAYVPD